MTIITYLTVLMVGFLFYASQGRESGILINVEASDPGLHAAGRYDLGNGNTFYSGRGDVRWIPNSFTEAVVLATIRHSGLDGLDILVLAFLVFIFWIRFRPFKTWDQVVFSPRTVRGFFFVVIAISISGSLTGFIRWELALKYIPMITHSRFIADRRYEPDMLYYGIGGLLFFFAGLPQRAFKLQQEYELK